MGSMSEFCPVCGAPTSNDLDISSTDNADIIPTDDTLETCVTDNSSNTSLVTPCIIDSTKTFVGRLEEAIALAAGHVKSYPLEKVEIEIANPQSPFHDNFYLMVSGEGFIDISNRPYCNYVDENILIMTKDDCANCASAYSEFIGYGELNTRTEEYKFEISSNINPTTRFDSSQITIKVDLNLNSKCAALSSKVDEFNCFASKYGKFVLDSEQQTLRGEVKTLPVKEGIFVNTKKLRQENEKLYIAVQELVLSSYQYLEDRL